MKRTISYFPSNLRSEGTTLHTYTYPGFLVCQYDIQQQKKFQAPEEVVADEAEAPAEEESSPQ